MAFGFLIVKFPSLDMEGSIMEPDIQKRILEISVSKKESDKPVIESEKLLLTIPEILSKPIKKEIKKTELVKTSIFNWKLFGLIGLGLLGTTIIEKK